MKKRKMVCSECGSEKVMRDSWAVWDFAKQEWALYNVFDDALRIVTGKQIGRAHV